MGPDTIFQCQLQVLSGFSSQGDIQGIVRSDSKLSGLVVFVGISSDKLQRKTAVKVIICLALDKVSHPQVGGKVSRRDIGAFCATRRNVAHGGSVRCESHADTWHQTVPQSMPP